MNEFNYYTKQSYFSDPKIYHHLLSDFPDDVFLICKQIHDLLLHETDVAYYKLKIHFSRYAELNARYLHKILLNIKNIDTLKLNKFRNPEERALSMCRDFSLLFCAVLRFKIIPARLRAGFVSYVIPGLYLGAFFAEYYNKKLQRWIMIDPITTDAFIDQYHLKIDFDLMDLQFDQFIPAAMACKLMREKKIDLFRFGVRQLRGFRIIRNHLIQDLALLNKREILVWDLWGLMLSDCDQHLEILDQLSDLLIEEKNHVEKIWHFYNQYDFLKLPEMVFVDNPFLMAQWMR